MMSLPKKLQKKFREVRYFLSQMQDIVQHEVGDPEVFDFLLSAFLSATFSITDALKNRKYGMWYERWRQTRTVREQQFLEFVRVQRIAEVHKQGAKTKLAFRHIPLPELFTIRQGHPAYGFHWSGPPGTPSPTVGVRVREFELGGTRVQAYETCREVTDLLGELLKAFETAHPNA